MAKKKKKSVVRCVVCGLKAVGDIGSEHVCGNVCCHEEVKRHIKCELYVAAWGGKVKNYV